MLTGKLSLLKQNSSFQRLIKLHNNIKIPLRNVPVKDKAIYQDSLGVNVFSIFQTSLNANKETQWKEITRSDDNKSIIVNGCGIHAYCFKGL